MRLEEIKNQEPEMSADEFQEWFDNTTGPNRTEVEKIFDGAGLHDNLSARECYMRSPPYLINAIMKVVKRK